MVIMKNFHRAACGATGACALCRWTKVALVVHNVENRHQMTENQEY